jgi:hypothetical protein
MDRTEEVEAKIKMKCMVKRQKGSTTSGEGCERRKRNLKKGGKSSRSMTHG